MLKNGDNFKKLTGFSFFSKRHSFRIVSGDSPKKSGNCVFQKNFHTKKLSEITAFYVVFLILFLAESIAFL